MANPIITTQQYPEIRAAIRVELTKTILPDKIIALDIYQGEAERWARKLDADADSRQSDIKRQLQTAIVLKCASLLIRALPHLVEESFKIGESFRRQNVDVDARAEELANRALDTINGYLAPTEATKKSLPTLFSKASGRRGE